MSAAGGRAEPLVTLADDGSLSCQDAALERLAAIDAPISCVAIVGPQRSGKSFILNCLADGPRFEVGPNVHACTKGIWMWSPPPAAAASGDAAAVHTIFLDTEGLGAVKASQHSDLRTFGLAVLLSSYFIFNTQGSIDEAAIKQLSFISQMTKAIHIRADVRRSPRPPPARPRSSRRSVVASRRERTRRQTSKSPSRTCCGSCAISA